MKMPDKEDTCVAPYLLDDAIFDDENDDTKSLKGYLKRVQRTSVNEDEEKVSCQCSVYRFINKLLYRLNETLHSETYH